ncbi:MAG TPA: NAD(P)/FAD-dependent oxidoreductase [Steroidobacteraceae bacterium]|nr:NAD(P)/FAD-dependent oxidoreductase [Steroidobacteraceae bacterium]
MPDTGRVDIVGAGPTGALLAILLQRRGLQVTLYEARKDPRASPGESGRSINLALADRGMHALRVAGVLDDLAGALVTMRGRQIHEKSGSQSLQLYGRRPDEVIYSISRHRLNQVLLDAAARLPGVETRFEHRLEDADFAHGMAQIRDLRHDRLSNFPMQPLLATDGAGSVTRRRMAALGIIESREEDLDHGYKELSIPAGPSGAYRMVSDALHIWPRGNFMLIALPNVDGSFTATLFLPRRGAVSFEALASPPLIERFFRTEFPDVYALMPNCVAEFQAHPTGFLGTVYANRWSAGATAALIGDAAHAIVPFHGQGMNCCFEDCVEFGAAAARHAAWQDVFAEFFASRKPNTDAIAAMALENYLEMRERVADPRFRLEQSLALELERRHPTRFIPRYSMVMFHHEISYRSARLRGDIQNRLLAELTAHAATLEDIDFGRASREISRELPPIGDDVPA